MERTDHVSWTRQTAQGDQERGEETVFYYSGSLVSRVSDLLKSWEVNFRP